MSKTLEELGYKQIWKVNREIMFNKKISDYNHINLGIQLNMKSFSILDSQGDVEFINHELHKAIELKMIELGLWSNE